jgi:hypothetical protein
MDGWVEGPMNYKFHESSDIISFVSPLCINVLGDQYMVNV